MADDGNEGEGTSRGNEWEVVSLTASTYNAAPGPKKAESTDDDKELGIAEVESSRAMFMSNHFVFPPSQHENLPLDPDICETRNEHGGEDAGSTEESGLALDDGNIPYKSGEENWEVKELAEVDEQHGIQFFEEKDISGSTAYDESNAIVEDNDPSDMNLDSPVDSKSQDVVKEHRSGPPCEAWWKRHAASFYSHAKDANAFWSVVVAATLMGLVILGQRWQQEKWQLQQLKWQFTIGNENINRVAGPISRFKDVLVGVQRRGPAIQGSASVER